MTNSVRLAEFDTWKPGYGFATVNVYIGGTNTLAALFLDQALTQSAPNPQTLIQQSFDGISYGKWAQPLYVGTPYYLVINDVDQTGVVGVPLTTLVGQDASEATVIPTGGSVAGNLDDILARTINVLDYGAFLAVGQQGASAVTNTNTLQAAVGQAGTNGGGYVVVPDGTFQITSFTLPTNVVVVGQGQNSTTLQSTQAGNVVTIGGSLAGFKHICLDGLEQVTNSVGLYALDISGIILEDVLVKRFSTGIELVGGTGNNWKDVSLNDCQTGYAGYGSSNTQGGGPGGGGNLEFNQWTGGIVQLCTTVGILIESIDDLCDHQWFADIQFNTNTGIALEIIGAHATAIARCSFYSNTTDLQVQDGSPINTAGSNTVIGMEVTDTAFVGTGASGGAINLSGNLANCAFRRCEFTLETITLTSPANNVVEQDCRQISGVTFSGSATAWIIARTFDKGKTIGLTTGNAATNAWSLTLLSGQRAVLKATIVARCRNNADSLFYYLGAYVTCTGATLSYVSDTGAFTAGNVVTGKTSGATARITVVTPSGSAGTLTLQDINGTFQNGEIITDTGGGSANVSGAITPGTASVVSQTAILAISHTDTNWTAAFSATAQTIYLQVTGDTSMNVEWFADVDVIATQQAE